jgi:hypothetical protein
MREVIERLAAVLALVAPPQVEPNWLTQTVLEPQCGHCTWGAALAAG